ncbi:MAG: T9SS type A sorting domain-containing protein [Ignavibacterium sp.]|nr:T9SS type A sorting domain-containing protein [Ignavibacterium sp.]MDW8374309.1 T9SS type A sorting domain-containing protein [Ignavibacteriales bacterium]
MKKFTLFFVFTMFYFNFVQAQNARMSDTIVIPPNYTSVPGTTTFLGPLANSSRSYQLLINESLLTPFINKEIVGLSWRLPTSATAPWPTSDVTFSNYDIYLSESVPPANRSLTFSNNVVGVQKLVRSGPLVIIANEYPFGGNPNEFGKEITFNQSYTYNGGHLLIEIRHQGFSGLSRSVDAIGTAISGYGTLFSALWQAAYIPTTGTQANFSVVKLRFENPIPVELTSFTAEVIQNKVKLLWTTSTELNNQGFEIQRKLKSEFHSNWETVGFVEGFGTVTEPKSYDFIDEVKNGVYVYRLKQIDFDGYFNFSKEIEVNVNDFNSYSLEQNFPNPFNPLTKIIYSIQEPSNVQLFVLNSLGEIVAVLVNEYQSEGEYSIEFNSQGLSSGIYFYKLNAGKFSETRKMCIIK